jgi:hypothetical protein
VEVSDKDFNELRGGSRHVNCTPFTREDAADLVTDGVRMRAHRLDPCGLMRTRLIALNPSDTTS